MCNNNKKTILVFSMLHIKDKQLLLLKIIITPSLNNFFQAALHASGSFGYIMYKHYSNQICYLEKVHDEEYILT